MQDPVLFLKILTIWDWKMAISPSCLTFCVYMYLYVHTQYPLNFSPLPGRIMAISLHLYIHLLECVMFNAWESWLGSTEKNIFFQKFEPLLWSVFISRNKIYVRHYFNIENKMYKKTKYKRVVWFFLNFFFTFEKHINFFFEWVKTFWDSLKFCISF